MSQLIISSTSRSFNNPNPQEYVVRAHVAAFTLAITRSLHTENTKQTYLRIIFQGDVFKFLFGNCNDALLYPCDFDPHYFTPGWEQFSERDDEEECEDEGESDDESDDSSQSPDDKYYGHTIVFPLKVKWRLSWGPSNGFFRDSDGTYVPKPRTFVEQLTIKLVKRNC